MRTKAFFNPEVNKSLATQLYIRLMNILLDGGGTCSVRASSGDISSSPIQNQDGLCPKQYQTRKRAKSTISQTQRIFLALRRIYSQSIARTLG